ncbi:DUF938 domain-containing protein [Shewanella waksmanii]|uniref:DUF938 domain-containing protein n=1 Tax=Shewanella waksmanii TaxID=213783 RepID=UPI0037352BB9
MNLPFSQACENNKQPIYEQLASIFSQKQHILEIGSGTGQHACFFANNLSHLIWQSSDQPAYLADLNCRIEQAKLTNLPLALPLDVAAPNSAITQQKFDGIYSANTLHIMSKPLVEKFFSLVGSITQTGASLVIYGPFNYQGRYTSDSNRDFDQWLLARDPLSAIRDIEWITSLAEQQGFTLQQDFALPANNRLLHFIATR